MALRTTSDDPSAWNAEKDDGQCAPRRLESWPVLGRPLENRRRAIALASDRTRTEIQRLLPWLPIDITFVSRVGLVSDRVESNCPEVVIIDTDLLGLPADLCKMAHSLRPDVLTVALVNHWSEREERLHGAVDAVLHKPPRREEWRRLFG